MSSVSAPVGQGQMVTPPPWQLQQHLPTPNIWKACLSLCSKRCAGDRAPQQWVKGCRCPCELCCFLCGMCPPPGVLSLSPPHGAPGATAKAGLAPLG